MNTQDFTNSTPSAESVTAGDTNTEGNTIQNTHNSASSHSEVPAPEAQGPGAQGSGVRTDGGVTLTSPEAHSHRSLAFWVKSVDVLVTRELEASLLEHGATRRDWRLLSVVARAADSEDLSERMRAKFARGGKRFHSLLQRGLVVRTDAGWKLTAEGRLMRERLNASVQDVRERVAGAVSSEDFDTTIASLEAMARELGWAEGLRPDYRARGGRRECRERTGRRGKGESSERRGGANEGCERRERGRGHGHGYGRGRGRGHDGCGNEDQGRDRSCGCGRLRGPECSCGRPTAHWPQRPQAFERGFAAGFTASRHDVN